MKSILQKEKECWFCGRTDGLELHHVYGGPNRTVSDRNGFTVWLCRRHHTGSNQSVHMNSKMSLTVKCCCQSEYEKTHTREEFRKLIGKSYL